MAVVAGSSRRRAFHNPRGRLRPRRGTRAGQATPVAAAAVTVEEGARAGSREGELNITKRAEGGMGVCGVEMMPVDYISESKTLSISRVFGQSVSMAETRADRVYQVETPSERGSRPFYIILPALSPSSLPSSLAPSF